MWNSAILHDARKQNMPVAVGSKFTLLGYQNQIEPAIRWSCGINPCYTCIFISVL